MPIDISVYEEASAAENIEAGGDSFITVVTGVATVESLEIERGVWHLSVHDSVSLAENVGTPTFNLTLFRGMNSVTVTQLNQDWHLIDTFRRYRQTGIQLKCLLLVPGGTDTFVIRDGSSKGAILYNAQLTATTLVTYPGITCRPMISYAECTLNTNHSVTFIW